MADTLTKNVLFSGNNRYDVLCVNDSDGTGGTQTAVDKSALTGPNGIAPGRLGIRRITYDVGGFEAVDVVFDHTTDDVAISLTGAGFYEFDPPLIDPNSAGDTGDILLVTVSNGAGATTDRYAIKLECVLKA